MATRKKDKYMSIQIVKFLMWTIGFWTFETKTEERALKGIFGYTSCAIALSLWIEAIEAYFNFNDFYAFTYTACSAMPVVTILLKIICFLIHRKKLMKMLKYTQEKFWYAQYDEYGEKLMDNINKTGIILICTFTFFVLTTVATYALTPLIENRGKNVSERILPFNWYIGIDIHVSPNFEIIFVLEVLALIHSGICFCCFDNFLILLNIHAAGQFKLLQRRLETVLERVGQAGTLGFDQKAKWAIHEEVRGCVLQHQELIWYSEQMENIFMYMTLGQLLASSIMICVAGFQIFLSRGTLVRRLIFIAHTNGSILQLFVVTFTAHRLLDESRAVGDSAYNVNWEVLSHQDNRGIRNAVLMMIVRSTRACSISAGGFFPVSLETFMGVMSTAASYFTLLRNFINE